MQICFILDSGPSTLQTYNTSFTQSGTNTNLSILEIFKYHIETSLNTLFRDGVLMREYTGLHLFSTSNPGVPLASFEHDFGHFMFQVYFPIFELKDMGNGFLGKNGDIGIGGVGGRGRGKISPTYPAETIKFALQHVAKFRLLTESESVMGYREATIYEPTVIILLSYGMTLRKIEKMESLNLHKYMRSEFKFIHYRLTLPQLHIQAGDKDKEITLKEFKEELENSFEFKRLVDLSERMNRGECKNIVKNTGVGCLSDSLTKMFTSYVPSFYTEFGYGFDLNNQFPEYFKPSEINQQNLGINSQMTEEKEKNVEKHKDKEKDVDKIKIDLIFRCDDNGNQIQSSIPIPLDINLKQEKHSYSNGEIWEIAEIFPLSFFVDFGKKLVRSISNSVPFDKYLISATNTPKLSKLEKELEILGISEIFFPVYTNVPLMAGASKRELLLTGLLHYSSSSSSGYGVNQSGFGYSFELILSYGSFPFIEWISNSLEMGDMRKIEKMMIEYNSILPDFYVRYLREYFKYLRVDLAIKYDNVILGSLQNNVNVMKNNHIKEREQVQYSLRNNMQEIKNNMEKLKIENILAHSKNIAECCVIYSPVENYKNYTRLLGTGAGSVAGIDGVLKKLLEAVGEINNHYGFDGYFGGIMAVREMPVTRELERYGGISRMINDEIEGEGDGGRDSRNQGKNEGGFGQKKVKKSENMGGNVINFYGIEEPDSVMPEENQSDPFTTVNQANEMTGRSEEQINFTESTIPQQRHLQEDSTQKPLLQPSFFQEKQVLPQVSFNPLNVSDLPRVNSSLLDSSHEESIVEGLPMRRSSSVDFYSEKGEVDSAVVDDVKIDVIEYVNSLPVESPVKVNFNAGSLIKDNRYREILGRLAGVGLVKDLGKFVVS